MARWERGEVEMPGSRGRYEAPERPEVRVDTAGTDVNRVVSAVMARLEEEGLVPGVGG